MTDVRADVRADVLNPMMFINCNVFNTKAELIHLWCSCLIFSTVKYFRVVVKKNYINRLRRNKYDKKCHLNYYIKLIKFYNKETFLKKKKGI